MNLVKWDKFYKFEEDSDELVFLRLYKIKNKDKFIMMNDKEEKIILNSDQLKEYTKLKSDGIISFSIVGIDDGLRDIVITYYRRQDVKKDGFPYIICRHAISNIFNTSNELILGCSISKDSCPDTLDFNSFIKCNSVESIQNISYYIGDKLVDILKPINSLKYNTVLKEYKSKSKIDDCSNTLKELLTDTAFMQDILLANNITPIYNEMDNKTFVTLSEKGAIIRYAKDIDLSKIEREHFIISDIKENIYIILKDKYMY